VSFLREDRARVRTELRDLEVVEVAGAAHLIHLSHPERVYEEMRKFLRD
jgi:pimeloyl-ACP methyl ester carboxylesterase